MSRRIGLAGILLASTFWLAGCALWEGVGPCYGIGCHSGLLAPGQSQQTVQARPAQSAKPSKSKPFAFLFRHHAAQGSANTSAAPQPSSTSAAPDQGH